MNLMEQETADTVEKINTIYMKKLDTQTLLNDLCGLQEKTKYLFSDSQINKLKEKMDFELFQQKYIEPILNYPAILFQCLCEYEKQLDTLSQTLKANLLILLNDIGVLEDLSNDSNCFYVKLLAKNTFYLSSVYDVMSETHKLNEWIENHLQKEV